MAYEAEKSEAVAVAQRAAGLCESVRAAMAATSVEKSDRSPVTVADFGSQALICHHLSGRFGDPIVGEEDAADLRKPENEALLSSVRNYVAEAGLANVRPAIDLDATASGWGAAQDGQNLIFLSNLLHLISNIEAWTLIDEAAAALAPGGRFIVYGPFMRGGELTSDGDASFHEGLQARDPEVGYKDDFDVIDRMQAAGLELVAAIEMPANNLALIAQAPGG